MRRVHRTARVVLALCLVSVLLTSVAAGQATQPPWAAGALNELQQVVDAYNAQVGVVDLGPAASAVRDEHVNLHVSHTDGTVAAYTFRTDALGRIHDLREGHSSEATVRMLTDRNTVARIAQSDEPELAFRRAAFDRDIRFEGISSEAKTVLTVINTVLWAVNNPVEAAVAVGVGVAAVSALAGGLVTVATGGLGALPVALGLGGGTVSASATLPNASIPDTNPLSSGTPSSPSTDLDGERTA